MKKLIFAGAKDLVEQQLAKRGNKDGGGSSSSSSSYPHSQPPPPQAMSYPGQDYGGQPPGSVYCGDNMAPYGNGYGGQPGAPYGSQSGGYGSQPGGYGSQPGGYGSQPGGYGGYPAQGGYAPQTGYPPQQPGYGNQPPYPGGGAPGLGFAQPQPQPGGLGFDGAAGGGGYPDMQMPGGGGPGYPTGGPGYPMGGGAPGYPPAAAPGYPSGQDYGQQSPYGGGGMAPYGGAAPMQYQQAAPSAPQQYASAPAMYANPSVRPYPAFNPSSDAETLRSAMKGLGCNNSKVVQVLCARSNSQRQDIARTFKTMYGKDLIKELKDELRGDFEDLILALMERPAVYDAMQLHKAMAGIGTKESVLIEIMTTRTNAQIMEVKQVYKQMYRSELERDLIGETSGYFKRLLISLCAGGRDESGRVDPVRANQDARKLYQAGEGRLGTDEIAFNAILAAQNYGQLRLVFEEYTKVKNGKTIEQAVSSEFSGDIRDGLLAICAVVRSKPAYFASLLHAAMKGAGTRDNDLIRAVVTRAEVDMADIRVAFEHMYKMPLEKMIAGDCSGAYKEGLIALVRGN